MVSRVERTPFAAWWWTVDRSLLMALLTLMLGGIVLSLAASPPVAARLGLEPFYFVSRHVLYLVPALAVLLATSFLPPRQIRRLALIVFAASLVLVVATLQFGAEVKGARRWIVLLGINVQPSEFLKPAFVILVAWLFAESARRPEMPANTMALALLLVAVAGLVMQPDFGQTMLVALVWSALFFLAGMRMVWVVGLGGAAVIGLASAYMLIPHVARRIERFRDPTSGDTFNIDQAIESFQRGGWFGRGPGEGTVKRILPESHTDFVFAVAAEEFGIVLCLVLVVLFMFIVLRALRHAISGRGSLRALRGGRPRDPVRLAVGDQHGGQLASHAGQGHDAAVHLLRRLVDDLARLGHGDAARPDARAPARRTAGGRRRARARRGPGLMGSGGSPLVLLAAGGTGGHLFPAEALAEALARRGVVVDLATDDRAERYGSAISLPSHPPHRERDRAPTRPDLARAHRGCARSRHRQALRLVGRIEPAAVVGFGGYPTVPPVLAATLRRIPTLIHEQNAVMGRANRLLAPAGRRHRD